MTNPKDQGTWKELHEGWARGRGHTGTPVKPQPDANGSTPQGDPVKSKPAETEHSHE